MNGFENADTYFIAAALQNVESLYNAARRISDPFRMRNLVVDAQMAGMIGDDLDVNKANFDEIIDVVFEE